MDKRNRPNQQGKDQHAGLQKVNRLDAAHLDRTLLYRPGVGHVRPGDPPQHDQRAHRGETDRMRRLRGVQGGHVYFSTGVFTIAGSPDERRARRDDGQMVFPVGFNANVGLRLLTSIGMFDLSVGNVLRRSPL